MCDCKDKMEKKLCESYEARIKDSSNIRAELKGFSQGINMKTGQCVEIAGMPYEITYDLPRKSGGVMGGVVKKKIKGTFHFSYCPFCGAKR